MWDSVNVRWGRGGGEGRNNYGLVVNNTVLTGSPAPGTAAAAARPGWVLPAFAATNGNAVNTIWGKHCGTAKFGSYHLVAGHPDRGRQSAWTFNVAITRDGRLHRVQDLRFTRYTPATVRT